MSNTWKIYLLSLVTFVLGTSQFGVVGILDKIAASTGVSLAAAGQLVTVFSLAMAIGTPLVMMLAAKLDRQKLLMVAIAIAMLGSAATLLLPGFGWLTAARSILGVATGVFYVTSLSLAPKLAASDRRGSALSMITMGFSASLILGVPIGRMVAGITDWKAIYYGIGLLCLLAIFAVKGMIPSAEGEAPVPLGQQLALLKRPPIALTLAVSLLLYVGYSTVYTYIAPVLSVVTHMSDGHFSIALFVYGIATLIGTRLGGFLTDRFGAPRVLVGSLATHALTVVALFAFARSEPVTFLLLVLWGIAAWAPGPSIYQNLAALAPEAAGIVTSMNSSIVQLGLAGGAIVGGTVTGALSLMTIGWIGAAIVALAAAVAAVNVGQVHWAFPFPERRKAPGTWI